MLGPLLGAGLEREPDRCQYRATPTVGNDRFEVTVTETAYSCCSAQCVVNSGGVVCLGEGYRVTRGCLMVCVSGSGHDLIGGLFDYE